MTLLSRLAQSRHSLKGVSRSASITTLADIGITSFRDKKIHLLDLLRTKESNTYPSPRILRGGIANLNARTAFSVSDGSGGSVDWLSTLHAFPSAFPRSHPASTSPPSTGVPKVIAARADFDKEEERRARKEDFEKWDEIAGLHSVESFYPASNRKTAEEQALKGDKGEGRQPQLWSVVQRLVPREPIKGGVTLVLAHANGFHKEIYEPTMQSMLNSLAKTGPPVAEIWSLDSVDAGHAGRINAGRLGLAVSWLDQSRDIQQFIDYYLPHQNLLPFKKDAPHRRARTSIYDPYPPVLPRGKQGAARRGRTLVGVGHSFSGAGMMMLSSLVAESFNGIFIIDPVGVTPDDFSKLPIPAETPLARGAIARKDVFSSLAAAEVYMKSKPFYTSWDPRVLDLHLQHGMQPLTIGKDVEKGPVALSMSKWREALAYSSYFMGTYAFAQLKRSTFKGWAHLICMSETSNLFFGEKGSAPLMQEFKEQVGKKATCEVLKGGHLVVQEQPDMLGARLAQVLTERMASSNES